MRKKPAVIKCFKTQLIKRKILQIAVQLRKLKHENLVKFKGYSLKPSAIVLEYCAAYIEDEVAHNLSQFISILNANEEFNWKERVDYIKQATLGLSYLHKNQITHRDFKPANMLVTGIYPNIHIKVTDFDDVVRVKETMISTMTINDHFKGMTLAYTAPELCSRAVMKASCETDIYSWGITSYEIVSDKPSAWSLNLPVMNDQLLLDALKNNERPPIIYIKELWCNEDTDVMLSLLSSSWSSRSSERPTCVEVKLIYLPYRLIFTMFESGLFRFFLKGLFPSYLKIILCGLCSQVV